MLEARVVLQRGDLHLDLDLRAGDDEVVALVGPNGAGKTTLLRVLAGLLPIAEGRVRLGDDLLEDPVAGVRVRPEDRAVAMVFQDYLLFPHLSVLDNVAYGLRAGGSRRRDARAEASGWLARVGVREQAGRRPDELSGGQAQRVAMARALATAPALLLLDEPLAAIDASARSALRRDLRIILTATPGARVVVTHDPVDAITLADRLVVLEHGRITQQGPLSEVTARPRSDWVAKLVGLNLYGGTAEGDRLVLPGGREMAVASDVRGPAFGLVHPRSVGLHRSMPEGSARNSWPGQIGGIDLEGDRVRVEVISDPPIVAEVTPQAAAELRLTDGGTVWASVKATAVDVYAA